MFLKFSLRFAFYVWKQNAKESKEKRQKKHIAESYCNQVLLTKVRRTRITEKQQTNVLKTKSTRSNAARAFFPFVS